MKVCNDFSDPNIVMLNGDRYQIMSTDRELLPLENVSNDHNLFSKPSCLLTHRFSLALHLMLTHLHYDTKTQSFNLTLENLLGTDRSLLQNIHLPYTTTLLQSRVLNDIFRQNEPHILSISKLIYLYLDLTLSEAASI